MFNTQAKKQYRLINRRSFFLLISKLGIFTFIISKFFQIQILQSKKYQTHAGLVCQPVSGQSAYR